MFRSYVLASKTWISKTIAIITVTLSIFIIGSFTVSFIASSITDLGKALPSYQTKLNTEFTNTNHKLEHHWS